jgi:hypothetical protein
MSLLTGLLQILNSVAGRQNINSSNATHLTRSRNTSACNGQTSPVSILVERASGHVEREPASLRISEFSKVHLLTFSQVEKLYSRTTTRVRLLWGPDIRHFITPIVTSIRSSYPCKSVLLFLFY